MAFFIASFIRLLEPVLSSDNSLSPSSLACLLHSHHSIWSPCLWLPTVNTLVEWVSFPFTVSFLHLLFLLNGSIWSTSASTSHYLNSRFFLISSPLHPSTSSFLAVRLFHWLLLTSQPGCIYTTSVLGGYSCLVPNGSRASTFRCNTSSLHLSLPSSQNWCPFFRWPQLGGIINLIDVRIKMQNSLRLE